jgi:hypothetical protein
MSPHFITLDVSGRKYRTQKATLESSPYFQNLLARWDDCSDRQEDGSYFIDADADTFQYVLDYMRRPSKFPLFWTKATGFNYALYNALEAEADYFLLHDLRGWIQEARYLNAIKTVVEVKVLSESYLRCSPDEQSRGVDVNVQSFLGSYSGEKRSHFTCGIHDTYIRYCDNCAQVMAAQGPHYDDPPQKLTLVITRTVFDQTVCMNETVA